MTASVIRVSAGFAVVAVALGLLAWSKTAATVTSIDFRDIAAPAGLTVKNTFGGVEHKRYILETTGNGVAIFDYDGDGKEDIFIANGTQLGAAPGSAPGPQLYHNLGNGKFVEVAAKAGLTATGWGQGVCAGDFDNDGHIDLMVTFYGHNVLYRNRGDGTFEDVTEKAHLPVTGTRYGAGCAFTDFDRDGNLDLIVSNYVDLDLAHTPLPGANEFCQWKGIPVMCGPRGLPKATNILYHNNGDGTFSDVSEAAGILKPGGRYGLGVTAADFDDDGWPDIYVACDQTPSLLYHNLHNGKFEERGAEAGVAFNFDGALQSGMGIAVADYDGDGRLDIAKTNFSGDLSSLYHNDDGKFFTDVSREAGLRADLSVGWGVGFIDVDDDGWPDLVIANGHVYPELMGKQVADQYLEPAILYRNLGTGKFEDVSSHAGAAFRFPRSARGLAAGDLLGDGREAIVLVNMNAAPSLLKNYGIHGHYLNVALTGTKSNRSAIGAKVVVAAGGRKIVNEVMSGGSYYSQNSLTLHFGLGVVTSVDSVDIRWPNGGTQTLGKIAADQTIHVMEQVK
jgi:hypothetical protein